MSVPCFRQALFGDHVKKPQSLEDTDLSRLYTATSLMQIDDNVMRWVPRECRWASVRPVAAIRSAQRHGLVPPASKASFHCNKYLMLKGSHRKILISWKWEKNMTTPCSTGSSNWVVTSAHLVVPICTLYTLPQYRTRSGPPSSAFTVEGSISYT